MFKEKAVSISTLIPALLFLLLAIYLLTSDISVVGPF